MDTITNNAHLLIVECDFEATQAEMWDALVNIDKIRKWYFNIAEFSPEVGFEFEFNGGSKAQTYVHKCRITIAEAPRRLAYTWCYENYEGNSFVSFELFEKTKRQTRLKLTHTGLETFPQQADFARESFQAGWEYIINTSLKGFIGAK
jgi:uncharacterized protein YndB with AHSA1/START domain